MENLKDNNNEEANLPETTQGAEAPASTEQATDGPEDENAQADDGQADQGSEQNDDSVEDNNEAVNNAPDDQTATMTKQEEITILNKLNNPKVSPLMQKIAEKEQKDLGEMTSALNQSIKSLLSRAKTLS